MKRSRVFHAFALAAVLLTTSRALAVTEQTSTTYAWTSGQALTVSCDHGSVRISTWDRDAVEVTVIKTASSRALLEQLKAQVDSGREALRVEARHAVFGWLTKAARDARIDFEIRVPTGLRRCVVQVDRGDARVEGLGGTVELRGDIASFQVRHLRGSFAAQTNIGRIEAGFVRLGENQQIDARTRNGSITLVLPEDTDAQLDAKAELSTIRCRIPVQVKRANELVDHVLIGGWGERKGKIILRSSKGPITIDRA